MSPVKLASQMFETIYNFKEADPTTFTPEEVIFQNKIKEYETDLINFESKDKTIVLDIENIRTELNQLITNGNFYIYCYVPIKGIKKNIDYQEHMKIEETIRYLFDEYTTENIAECYYETTMKPQYFKDFNENYSFSIIVYNFTATE